MLFHFEFVKSVFEIYVLETLFLKGNLKFHILANVNEHKKCVGEAQ